MIDCINKAIERRINEEFNRNITPRGCTYSPFLTDKSKKLARKLDKYSEPFYPKQCNGHQQSFEQRFDKKEISKQEFDQWLKRNYTDPVNNKKLDEEEKANKPKYMESETYFIPNISTHSKNIADSRNNVYEELYGEAKLFEQKKKGMFLDLLLTMIFRSYFGKGKTSKGE